MNRRRWIVLIVSALFFILYAGVIIYHQQKELPEGVAYEGENHTVSDKDITFLYDLTYPSGDDSEYDHSIFSEVLTMIDEAESFIILDMFMFNETSDEDQDYPAISGELSDALLKKHEENPDMDIVVITDPINTTYFSHPAKHIDPLEKAGIEVVYTDLERLRDPTPLVTGAWRIFAQWFGQEGFGWLPNPFGPSSPDATLRSYLKMANIKANHRKALITDHGGLYMSWNAHDASGFHSNIALRAGGDVLRDMIESEKAVAAFSDGDLKAFPDEETIDIAIETYHQNNDANDNEHQATVQVITERQIETAFLEAVDEAEEGDEIWIGMFYLADRNIINGLVDASERGVYINIILDPNQNAFGQEKIGLPNVPVSEELMDQENMNVRWYNTQEEQYHSKISYIRYKENSTVIAGSTNYTSRNLNNYNLENNLRVDASNEAEVIQDVDQYFQRIWRNDDAEYTLDYDAYHGALTRPMYFIYILQQLVRFTTY